MCLSEIYLVKAFLLQCLTICLYALEIDLDVELQPITQDNEASGKSQIHLNANSDLGYN